MIWNVEPWLSNTKNIIFLGYPIVILCEGVMSLFALPRNAAELVSANQGTANAQYRQITSTRNVQKDAFADGVIQFRFETGGNTWFVPDKSYFRIRYTITQVRVAAQNALPALSNGDIAPAMGLASQLFKSVEVRLEGQTVERIGERLPQIDALKTRMTKSKAWMETVGKDTNHWPYDFRTRNQQIAVDGYQRESSTWVVKYDVPLTQLQAGFDAASTIAWTILTGQLTLGGAADDWQFGKPALRAGDIVIIGGVAEQAFEIINIISPTVAQAKSVNNDKVADIAAAQANIFNKLKESSHNDITGKNSGELVWQPPLGFFDKQHAIPPGGTWTIEFDPQNVSSYKKGAVQSCRTALEQLSNRANKPADFLKGDFDFVVDQMYLYLYTVDANRFDNGDYFLDIQNVRCQLESMPIDSTSLTQKNFEVPGKTNALTLAFQDIQAGVSTLFSRSLFKIRPGLPVATGGFAAPTGQEQNLTRFYINYNNMQKPSPDFDGKYTTSLGSTLLKQTNNLTQRWADTLLQAGAYHTEGGAESLKDWLNRGMYFHFLWPKDAVENNTRVNINYQFSQVFTPGDKQHKLLLFSWWRTAYHIVHRNGRVEKMSVEEL